METAPFGAVKPEVDVDVTVDKGRNGDRSFRSGEARRLVRNRNRNRKELNAAMETAPFGAVKWQKTAEGLSSAQEEAAAMETAPFGAVKANGSPMRWRAGGSPQWRPLLSER